MPETKPKYYVTTPIYYVNARPHIGHAYTTIVADVVARRRRLLGDDVWFLTGTDEHGQKIERAAKAAGTSPQEFADSVSAQFEGLWKRMGITHNQFIRTTDKDYTRGAVGTPADADHKRGVEKLFRTLQAAGKIEPRAYTGAYCVSDETFVDASVGTPCPDCGRILEEVTEENYFFKLSEYQVDLIDLIESNRMEIQSEARRNEVLSFLRGDVNAITKECYPNHTGVHISSGYVEQQIDELIKAGRLGRSAAGNLYVPKTLKDLSISRTSFKWGIPVPGDERHVIYVWLDALTNYISAIGYGDPTREQNFEKFWPADLHLVGKEIIRFHCVYWPAFLMAAKLPTPKKIVAHGWLLFEESKMSKSRGNIVRAETILDAFGSLKPEVSKSEQDLFGADVLRYFLLREIPFGQDGSFSFDALVTRYNADLANGYGNLVSRVVNMIHRYCGGELPDGHFNIELANLIGLEAATVPNNYFDLDFSAALENCASMIRLTDQFITSNAPWKIADDTGRSQEVKDVLFSAAEAIRIITVHLHATLPYTTNLVLKQLNLELQPHVEPQWQATNHKLNLPAPLFPRADKELITRMNEMEQNNNPAPAPVVEATPAVPAAPAAEEKKDTAITIDDFMKVELRVAQIKVAERIPKADKLLRLEVDLGSETRQILSGIAEHYTPEELIGRRIVIVANLAPRKMRGLESHGMLLAASVGDGDKPVLATVPDDAVLGSRVR